MNRSLLNEETKKFLGTITTDDVVFVYTGAANKCCCGCTGKYSYNPLNRNFGSRNRGYKVTDDECSERAVKMGLNKLMKNLDQAEVVNDSHLCFSTDSRLLMVFFKKNVVK